MKRLMILLSALILCCHASVSSAVAAAEPPDPESVAQAGQMAPDFNGMTTDNSQISLSSLRGRVVVLSFFATW